MPARRRGDREIAALAIPALGALVAEPLFLLVDTGLVGHLGTAPLAGLGLASAVLGTLIGLLVFLAYATTPAVARRIGLGDLAGALRVGVDGVWFALGIGILLGGALAATAPVLVRVFSASDGVAEQATTYLAVSALGIPAMLGVLAATGVLRGLQDTRTPLVLASAGFALNAALNALLIYGAGLGIAGSALGTVLAQWAMFAGYAVVVVRAARRHGVALLPHGAGVRGIAGSGAWLLLRTASLRIALLLAVGVAATLGGQELAAYSIAATLLNLCAFALDALAIAAQALVGRELGAGNAAAARAVLRRCLVLGVAAGVLLGILLLLFSPVLGAVFSTDAGVRALLPAAVIVLAIAQPIIAVVCVLDGVLIGAGDGRYLAVSGAINLAVFAALLGILLGLAPTGITGLVLLQVAYTVGYMAARSVTLGLRARGVGWQRLGA
jgi:putative MATE family efflux protein